MDRVYINNSFVAKLQGLKDRNGALINNALVSCRVLDRDKAAIIDYTWSMSNIGNGNYECEIDSDLPFVQGQVYYLEVTATIGTTDATWRTPVAAQERE